MILPSPASDPQPNRPSWLKSIDQAYESYGPNSAASLFSLTL
jgi:hypothetical protein